MPSLPLALVALGLSVALLWLPFPSLSYRCKLRASINRHSRPELGNVFGDWRNYVDFFRSALACFVLTRMLFTPQPVATEAPFAPLSSANWAPFIPIAIGLIFQTVRSTSPLLLAAPIFYISGITLLLPQPLEAIFALAVGWLLTLGTSDPRLFLLATGISLVLVSVSGHGPDQKLIFSAAIIFTPVTLAFFSNRQLFFFLTRQELFSRQFAKAAPIPKRALAAELSSRATELSAAPASR